MIKIDNIEIKNFKSIRNQRLEGCKRVNLFIGSPNVGKSNLLEALGLFSITDMNTAFASFVRIANLTDLFFNGQIDHKAEIRLNVSNRMLIEYNNSSVKFTNEFDSKKYGFSEIDKTRMYVDNRKESSAVNSFSILSTLAFNAYSGISFYNHEDSVAPVYRYQFSGNVAYKSGSSDRLNSPFGENIFDVLSANDNIRKEVSDIFKNYELKFSFDKSTREFKILKDVGDDIFLISYSMIADTLHRLIFFKTAIQSNKDAVLLFEEPEAHMFSPYISKFTNDIINDENNNQFFVTTHSPFVLNELMENLKSDELAVFIVSLKKNSGETIINRLGEDEMHEAYQFGYDFFMNIDKFISEEQYD